MGGDVVPSFGGYSADQGGTEIADSCRSVPAIARAYESVVTTYGVTHLDMDVEANSLNKPAGIARRSAALRLLQDWAARTHRHVRITFTLGVEPWGLPANCLADTEERGGARRPVLGQHHGLRLLHQGQQDRHRDGHRGDPGPVRHAPPARAALPGAQPAAAVGPGGHHAAARHRRLPEEDRGDVPAATRGRSPSSPAPTACRWSPSGPSSATTAAARAPSTATPAPASASRGGRSATCWRATPAGKAPRRGPSG